MSSVKQLATCVKNAEQTPPLFRHALMQRIAEHENVGHLVFSPPAWPAIKGRRLCKVLKIVVSCARGTGVTHWLARNDAFDAPLGERHAQFAIGRPADPAIAPSHDTPVVLTTAFAPAADHLFEREVFSP
jgi:hypothetical protein